MTYEKGLTDFVHICREAFREKLVGVYLHGSAAMGCFRPQKSDLDLLVIVDKETGTDRDLAAHFVIVKRYGRVLYGEAIDEVFGEVGREAYVDSIRADIENAAQDILTEPVYFTLNLCRVLAYLRENLVLSKKAGGEWGLRALPEKYHPILQSALDGYAADQEPEPCPEAAEYAEYMLSEIRKQMGQEKLLPGERVSPAT